ncbi:AAA family ATPase [Georgenia muralis]|uniref:ATPase family protein associated with various cellular activities (AAA) n=1 Tax=Georgenia muralis TaxID=154117 RepID=A0A3N5A6I7_9MICO|nr:AAA family ATPase [Georgenia muralis]RPF29005.1 ATPase family protein associated with various cellular activities (AAA) [Georgenia muralis]
MTRRMTVFIGPFSSEPFTQGLRALLGETGEFTVIAVEDVDAAVRAAATDEPVVLVLEGSDPAACRRYLDEPAVRMVVLLDPAAARSFVGVDNARWTELADVVRALAGEARTAPADDERDRIRVVHATGLDRGVDAEGLAPLAGWVETSLALALTRRFGESGQGVLGWSVSPREALEMLGVDPARPQADDLAGRLADVDDSLFVSRHALPTAVADVADAYHLTDQDLRLLSLVLAPEIDGRYATAVGVLQDDLTRRRPSLTLLAELLTGEHLSAWDLRRARSLVAVGLIRPVESEAPAVDVGYAPSAAVLAHLLAPSAEDAAARLGAQLRASLAGSEPPLSAAESDLARQLEDAAHRATVVRLVGGDGAKRWFSRLTAWTGVPLVVGDLAGVEPGARAAAAGDWSVLAHLLGGALLLLGTDTLDESERHRVGDAALPRAGGLVAADGDLGPARSRLVLRAPSVPATERATWWARAAEHAGLPLRPGDAERLAATVVLEPATFDDAAALAAQHRGAGTPGTAVELVQRAARDLRPATLPAGVRSVAPVYGWDDIVLGEENRTLLKAIPQHVLHAGRVLEEWGFAARVPYGQGVAALFSGPSGTGKTMAAQIIARDLGVDLLQVDLSKTVSKYIGETEKNLDRVFDAAERTGAVLLFDEADAVFGKRTEIKDAHDRHANVEVAYLLQRLESFRGLTILTTNLKANIDGAFLRRLRFVVDFAVPTAAERARIWHKAFPPAAPLDGLDVAAVASRLPISGGSIQSIALHAAFLAAPGGGPIGLDHVRTATRRELRKTGLLAAEKTLDDWPVPEERTPALVRP